MDTANEPLAATNGDTAPTLTATLRALRERCRELLRVQSNRLRELEAKLEQQFTAAVERVEQEPREIAPAEQQLFDRAASLEKDVKHLQQLRRESEQALEEARLMLGELEEERRILRDRLDQAENRGSSASPAPAPAATEETERLNRRLEMAMQEIRELKYQNSELAEQVKRPSSGPKPVESSSHQFDWETQKQRLLEQLATSFDGSDPVQVKEKLRCEEVIRATDRTIAEKDREIAELRKLLEEQSSLPAATSVDPAAAEAILSTDEVIRAERERLAQVQAEWQEKLRQAEVEISIERAKLGRERSQMEEKMRILAAQNASEPAVPGGGDPKAAKGGRWLNRLGLGGEKDNP